MNKTVHPKLIVACYFRFSTIMQKEDSIEAQRAACVRYCAQNGWEYNEDLEYIDRAKSGSSAAKRTNFNRMLKDAEERKFDILLVHKMDRFSRSIIKGGLARYTLEKNNIKIRSVTENISETPIGKLTANMLACINEYYIDNLSTEVHKVMDEKARKGLFLGGTPPLGLRIELVDDEKVYAVDETEAAIVREIFTLFVEENIGYSKIAQTLNAEGKRTKYGNEFCQNAVREIILNEKYIGVYEWNKRMPKDRIIDKRNHHAYKDKDQIIRVEDIIPAIIDKETFMNAQAKIRKNSGHNLNRNSYKATEPYLLHGKVICGKCGRRMTGNRRKGGRNKESVYSSYDCPRRSDSICKSKGIKKELLENAVMNLILSQLTEENLLRVAKRVSEYRQKCETPNYNRVEVLRNGLSDMEIKTNNILESIMAGNTTTSLNQMLKTLDCEKAMLQKELDGIEAETQVLNYDINLVKQAAHTMMTQLINKSPARLEKVFNAFIEKIVVDETSVEIHLSLSCIFVVYNAGFEPPQPLKPLISNEISGFLLTFLMLWIWCTNGKAHTWRTTYSQLAT